MAGGDDKAPAAEPHYHGHRQRLREKLIGQGPESLADYEVLELVLMMAQPRRDVKPLAKDLLRRFGGFGEVISADPALLRSVTGLADASVAALKLMQAASVRLLKDRLRDRPLVDSWDRLIDYCLASMAHELNEHFRVLYLDNRLHLIADEVQQRGTINHTPVYPREVVRRALELGAGSLIIVHNHPAGDPTPSAADKLMTKQIRDAVKAVEIALHDHLVIGRSGYFSFKNEGLL